MRRADHKAVDEVEAREYELSAGFVECRYTGLVTLTARSAEELDLQAADLEQAAANSSVELQPTRGPAGRWVGVVVAVGSHRGSTVR